MGYAGLFNSSYHPGPLEEFYISTPTNQLGPILSGEITVTLLQGMMFVQYWQYLTEYWGEKRWTKWLVHATFFLCIAKFAYVWWITWDRFVPHFGDWAYLAVFSPLSVPVGISTTIPSAVCQIFFIHRCWVLSRNLFFVIPAVLSLIMTVGAGISLTYGSALAAGGDVKVTKLILTSINISLSSALVCDIFITTFTCYYLVQKKTGYDRTDGLLMRLVKCSIESATGPTIFALINLIFSNLATDNQWFLFPNLALSHVYGCSLLYSVNARRAVACGNESSTGGFYSRSTPGMSTTGVLYARNEPLSHPGEFPMQSRSMPEVYVDVQHVMRQEESTGKIVQQNQSLGSGGKQACQDDPYVAPHKPGNF